jgi:hypothetical protein
MALICLRIVLTLFVVAATWFSTIIAFPCEWHQHIRHSTQQPQVMLIFNFGYSVMVNTATPCNGQEYSGMQQLVGSIPRIRNTDWIMWFLLEFTRLPGYSSFAGILNIGYSVHWSLYVMDIVGYSPWDLLLHTWLNLRIHINFFFASRSKHTHHCTASYRTTSTSIEYSVIVNTTPNRLGCRHSWVRLISFWNFMIVSQCNMLPRSQVVNHPIRMTRCSSS